jgi:hypothetical protein
VDALIVISLPPTDEEFDSLMSLEFPSPQLGLHTKAAAVFVLMMLKVDELQHSI